MPYNFDIQPSHARQPESSPTHRSRSVLSDGDPDVTWLADEPALSPPASSQTICSRQPRAKSSPIRETHTLATLKALQTALAREGLQGRPSQVESNKTSSSEISRMNRRTKPGPKGFQPRNTLSTNVHSSPVTTYAQGKAGRNFMHGGQHLAFATLTGDNVPVKTTYEFPDDEHQHKRRKTESKINTSGTANFIIKRITSDCDSSTAVGSARQRRYAEDSLFGTQESRTVEARVQSNRLSARNLSPRGPGQPATFRTTSTEGEEPLIWGPRSDVHTTSRENSVRGVERRVSDPEVHESAPRLNNMRTSLDEMIDLTEDTEEQPPDASTNGRTDRPKVEREPSIQVLNERVLGSNESGTENPRHSVQPTLQAASRIVSHHFQKPPIEQLPTSSKPLVEYSDNTEQDSDKSEHVTSGRKEQLVRYPLPANAMATGQNNFTIDLDSDNDNAGVDDKARRSETPGSPKGLALQEPKMLAELREYASMQEDADTSVDELASAETSKPSQGFIDTAKQFVKSALMPTGHSVNHGVKEGAAQTLINMVRRKSGSSQPADPVPDSTGAQDDEIDDLALPVTPPKIANSIPPLHNSDIPATKVHNLKKVRRTAGDKRSTSNKGGEIVFLPKQINNMGEVRLLFHPTSKTLRIEHKMTMLDDADNIDLERVDMIRYGLPDSRNGKVRLRLRRYQNQAQKIFDLRFVSLAHVEHFIDTISLDTSNADVARIDNLTLQKLFNHGPSASTRPSRAEIEPAVDEGVENTLISMSRNKDQGAAPSPITRVERLPLMRDSMRVNGDPTQTKTVASRRQNSNAESPSLANDSTTAALDILAPRPRRTTRNVSERQHKEASAEPFEVPESRKFSRTTGLGTPWDQPVVYPPTGRNKATVNFDDLRNLDEGDWLNDSIIEFQIRWLFAQHKPRENQVFSFSTHFYSALTDTERGKSINYAKVQRWTARDDIFSKDLVIVPVNEDLHWYLMLIINLPAVRRTLPDADPAPEVPALEDKPQEEPTEKEPVVDDTVSVANGSIDVIVPTNPDEDVEMVDKILEKAAELNLDSRPATAGGQKEPSDVESCISGTTHSIIRRKGKSRAPPVRKYKDDQPMIITLDPLGGNRSKTIANLKDYLIAEGLDKRAIVATRDTFQGLNVTKGIPTQDNFYDCGVYILAYIDKLMQDPAAFARKLIRKELDEKEDFGVLEPNRIRAEIRTNLMRIAKEQQTEQRAQKAERRKQRKAEKQAGNVSGQSSPVKGRKEEPVRDAEQEAMASIPDILSTAKKP